MKTVIRDHLKGVNGRPKVKNWVPRWMVFPPSGYTARGGIGTVKAHALVAAAQAERDHPDPDAPAGAAAPTERERLAA